MKTVNERIPWTPHYVQVKSKSRVLTIPFRVPQEILVLVEDGQTVWRWNAWLN